ncbi:MAG: serine hydrolase [Myxococcales bacterium]|nr:serine hydrolase [Myxococcales bacterium]
MLLFSRSLRLPLCLLALVCTATPSFAQSSRPAKSSRLPPQTPTLPCPSQKEPPPCKTRPLPNTRDLRLPPPPTARPSKLTKRPTKQKPDVQALIAYLKKTRVSENLPGISIAVVDAKHIFFTGGVGYSSLEKKQPVTAKTIFAIGSTSKAFTATALAMLVDQKKLSWKKPIRTYMPDFQLHDAYVTQKLNTLDLLSHRSGLPRHDLVWYGSSLNRKQLYQRLRYLKANKSFREGYQYQNLMYMTAGLLIERLSGMTWEKFVQKYIFAPLGMKDSGVSKKDYFASPHRSVPYNYHAKTKKHKATPFRDIDAIGPAGSIVSNAQDMARWVQLQLNYSLHRKPPLVSRSGFWMMHTPHSIIPVSPYLARFTEISYLSYGLAWIVARYRGDRMIFHTGGIDGYTAIVSFLPQRNLGLVLLTNQGGYGRIMPLLWESYDILLRRKPTPWLKRFRGLDKYIKHMHKQKQSQLAKQRVKNAPSTHPLKAFAGTYKHPAYGKLRIEYKNKALYAHYHSSKKPFPLRHYHYNVFHLVNVETQESIATLPVVFQLNLRGQIHGLKIPLEPSLPPLKFRRVPKKPTAPKRPRATHPSKSQPSPSRKVSPPSRRPQGR